MVIGAFTLDFQKHFNMDQAYLELIIDLHLGSDRQGPGSDAETLKALSFTKLPVDQVIQVADLGCGSGGQTLSLAKALNAHITAVDFLPAFLDELNQKAQKENLSEKITPLAASIDQLPFEKESLDLIWSEGAIYNLGFERGITEWREYLKPKGYLAVSEITWTTNNRPKEIEDFWQNAYPEIDNASNKIKHLEAQGYTITGYFYLDPSSWLNKYYEPMENRFDLFLARNKKSEAAKAIVKEHQDEIELYRKYQAYYSYGFYIARKN